MPGGERGTAVASSWAWDCLGSRPVIPARRPGLGEAGPRQRRLGNNKVGCKASRWWVYLLSCLGGAVAPRPRQILVLLWTLRKVSFG